MTHFSLGSNIRDRAVGVWWPRWRRRALFVVGGIVVGTLAVAMAIGADDAQKLFNAMVARWPAAPFLLGPGGLAFSAWLTRRFFPGAQGSGIPQVIAAHRLEDLPARARLVSLRIAVGKIILLMLGLVCGASAGREGPTVQVGASTMFLFGRVEPHRQPGLLLAGSAAGIAAASRPACVAASSSIVRPTRSTTSSMLSPPGGRSPAAKGQNGCAGAANRAGRSACTNP